ncbi:hypothetical protein BJY01DRAFT_255787 [Aspergillus pseudoustus]|uniref:Uncharacterized protein n=1 Tax=Aspergillus pseudoustus TaxID=1810923 RepID=A0ABR4IH83_9EURO
MTTSETREEIYTATGPEQDTYAHSGDDDDDNSSAASPDPTELEKQASFSKEHKLEVANAYRTAHRKGALRVRFVAPRPGETKVSTTISYIGEREAVEEESPATLHPSFEAYHKPANLIKLEEVVYFDCEAHPKYHSVYPGALTVHGYAWECWEFEEMLGPQIKADAGRSNDDDADKDEEPIPLSDVLFKQVVRRMSELAPAKEEAGKEAKLGLYAGASLGTDPEADKSDVIQFIGRAAMEEAEKRREKNIAGWDIVLDALFIALNRGEGILDCSTEPTLANEWVHLNPEDGHMGMCAFLRQMVISAEILRRLKSEKSEKNADGDEDGDRAVKGFRFDPKHLTMQTVSSLIVAQQWMANQEPRWTRGLPLAAEKPVSAVARKQADEAVKIADQLIELGVYAVAADTLTVAVEIDPANVEYRQTRGHALLRAAQAEEEVGNEAGAKAIYEQTVVEACRLTQYLEKDWLTWALYAKARIGWGGIKEGLRAWEHALELATEEDDKQIIKDNIVAARMEMAEELISASHIQDRHEQRLAVKAIDDWDFDLLGNVLRWCSTVYTRQEQGLIAFAESIKWPYIEEVRHRVTGLYDRMLDLKEDDILPCVHDWLHGLSVPGRWYADSLINALVSSSASLKSIGISTSGNLGLVLTSATYWRTTTTLGRVLAALPGVVSVNGWVGPCPPAKVNQGWRSVPQARWVDVPFLVPALAHRIIKTGDNDPVDFCENEEIDTYLAEIMDVSKWTIPGTPEHDPQRYAVKSINLKPSQSDQDKELDLVCDANITFEVHNPEPEEPMKNEKRQSLTKRLFRRDKKTSETIRYDVDLRVLSTFVVLPKCHTFGEAGHPVHNRELHLFQLKAWTPAHLVDDDTWKNAAVGDVIVINATGEGAEIMARAICCLRSLSAAVRKPGGPCFACSVKSARRLRILALIWCD